MKMLSKTVVASVAIAVTAVAGSYAFTAWSQERDHGFGPNSMHRMDHGMMGMGARMMGMGHGMMGTGPNAATMAEMRGIHDLFANNDRIRRTVTNLPDGIRTVTESDDPRLAETIKTHVADMGKRVREGRDPGLPIESPALRAIFQNKDKIKTAYETTEKGVIVVQTSSDQEVVKLLQTHAAEVSEFVRGGMAAMRTAMMRNGGMMGGGMMRGGMMQGGGMRGDMHRRMMGGSSRDADTHRH
jgi:hypothetical protein